MEIIAKKRKTNSSLSITDPLYSIGQLVKPVQLKIDELNEHYVSLIKEKLKFLYENKCLEEGFIQPNSIHLHLYPDEKEEEEDAPEEISACKITKGNICQFMVTFQCKICLPVEGMIIACRVSGVTMAMIQAESSEEFPSPILVFISLDNGNEKYSDLQKDAKIIVEVISHRFELNHRYIEIMGNILSVE